MYKSIGFLKHAGGIPQLTLAIHKFKKSCKDVHRVYNTGIYFENLTDCYSIFLVLFTFRIIISLNKNRGVSCGN